MSKPIRWILLLALAISGCALLMRALAEPYRFLTISVGSPVNAQSIFGVSLILLLLLAARSNAPLFHSCHWDRRWYLAGLAALLIGAFAFYPSLFFHILSDDFYLFHTHQNYIQEFPAQVENIFFRPVGFLVIGVVGLWAGSNLTLWHAAGLAFHIIATGLLFVFVYRFIGGRWAAFMAAALFALHGSRPEAVVWLAGWFDVFAIIFLLAGLLFFLRDLDRDSLVNRLAALVCMAAAMFSKETGFVFPLLLPLVAWKRGKLSREILPRLGVYFAVTALLFAYRWYCLGGIGGYTNADTGAPEALSFKLLGPAKVLLLRVWAFFCYPLNWSIEPGLLLSCVLVVGVICYVVLATSKPARRDVLFALGFILLSVLPAIHQLLIGADMEKSRGLYSPSVGFCILLGVAVESLGRRKLQGAVCVGLLLFHFAILRHNLAIWGRVSQLAKTTCASAGRSLTPETQRVIGYGLPGIIDGVYFFQNGFWACLESVSGRYIGSVEMMGIGEQQAAADDATLLLRWDNDSQRIMPVRENE